jgi:hypothetical protein
MASQNSQEEPKKLTPPEVVERYENAMVKLLPPASKAKYDRVYAEFIAWQEKSKTTSFSERTIMAFLDEKRDKVSPNTLWGISSMLKSTLLSYHNIDLSKYPKLTPYLKRNSVGYQPKKAKIFRHEEMDRFLLEAPDEQFLMKKVFFSLYFNMANKFY